MSPWASSLLAIAVVSGIPLGVTLLLAVRATAVRRFLPHFTALGAGALFGAALLHLIPESYAAGQAPVEIAISVIIGYAVFALIDFLLGSAEHDHGHDSSALSEHHTGTISSVAENGSAALAMAPQFSFAAHDPGAIALEHSHQVANTVSRARAKALVPLAFVGDTVHNLVDGMLIAAGFLANPAFGVLTAVAIGLHELPRELGTYGLFVHGGVHPLRAVGFNMVTAFVAFLGAAVTLMLGSHVANFGQLILPFAAGSYLYIAAAIARPVLATRPREIASLQTSTAIGTVAVPRARDAMRWLVSGFVLMALSAILARVF